MSGEKSQTRWTLRGGLVLTGGRSVDVEVVLLCPSDLTMKETRELRGARVTLHDLTPVEETKVPATGSEDKLGRVMTMIDRLREVVQAEPGEDSCTSCNAPMEMRSGDEPTAVCDHCAHAIVQDDLPKLLAVVEAAGLRGDHCIRGPKEHDAQRCVGCGINEALRAMTDGSNGAGGPGLDGLQRHRV